MLNWREYPFLRLVIPLMGGIFLADNVAVSLSWVAAITLISIFLAIGFSFQTKYRFQPVFGIIASITIFSIGYWSAIQYNELTSKDHFRHQLNTENKIVGWVYDAPEVKNWVKVKLVVEGIGHQQASVQSCSGNLLVYLEIDSLSTQIKYGDLLYFDTHILPTLKSKNPDGFDFSKYLHYKNIHHQTFVRAGSWNKVAERQGNPLVAKLYEWRVYLLDMLQQTMSNDENFAVAAAILLGYRAELSEEIITAYSETGAIHVLAVSGLHVAILFWIVEWLLAKFSSQLLFQRWLKTLLCLSAIWLFTLLTGASASILRAAIMFSFIIIGKHLNRNTNIYNNLAAAAFFSLLFYPNLLFEIGFQLSYLAVVGIVFFQPHIYQWWQPSNRILDYFWELTAVSLAVQIMAVPITLYYFHQFPFYFWLSGLIVIPASTLMLPVGILLFILNPLIPIVGLWLGKLMDLLVFITNTSILFIQRLPGAVFNGIWLTAAEFILLDILVVMVMIATSTQKLKHWFWCGILFTAFLVSQAVWKTIAYFEEQIVVYHVNKGTIIDFFDGREVYSLCDADITPKDVKYTAMQHRWAKFSKLTQHWILADSLEATTQNLWVKYPYFQFYNQRWVVVEDERWSNYNGTLDIDYVLLRNTPDLNLEALSKTFNAKAFIFDASNSFASTQAWIQTCKDLGIKYIDVRTEGAFLIEIEN